MTPKDAKKSILIVEDDQNSQMLFSLILKNEYELFDAVSIEEGKEHLKVQGIELILLDLSLEGNEDGLELAKYVRQTKEYEKIPIIVTSAHATQTTRSECEAAGCNEYLAKPIMPNILKETIKEYLK